MMREVTRVVLNILCHRKLRFAWVLVLCVGLYVVCRLYSRSSYNRYITYIHSKKYTLARDGPDKYVPFTGPSRVSSDIFTSLNLTDLNVLLQPYKEQIEKHREEALSKTSSQWNQIKSWELIDAYNENYFKLLENHDNVKTVYLTAEKSKLSEVLLVENYFDYGSDHLGCQRLVQKDWTIYYNGKELYNKTCRVDLRETLIPRSIDSVSLSVGLPYQQQFNSVGQPGSSQGGPQQPAILTFVNIIENGLVSGSGEVFSGTICIKPQRCNSSVDFPPNQDQIPHYDEVLTITQQNLIWYYHATLEDLPRVTPYLSFLQQHQNIKVHISYAGFHVRMLEIIGIQAERLVWGAVRARVVYLPAGTTCGRPSVFTVSLLSLLMRRVIESMGNPQGNPQSPRQDTILLMKRADPYRQLRNHDAILTVLHKVASQHNLKVEVFSDSPLPPMEVYMQMFHRAKVVIGPHGSGLANILFTRPGTLVMEGLCYMKDQYKGCMKFFIPWICRDAIVSLTFRNVATVLGNHYYGVMRDDNCLYITPEDLLKPLHFYLQNLHYL